MEKYKSNGKKKAPAYVWFIVGIVLVVVLIELTCFITYPNEYNVVKTMGRITNVVENPGFSVRIPLIQTVNSISKAKQLYDIDETEIYTSDKKKMVVNAYVIWHITDPTKYTQTLSAATANAESKINSMVYNAMKVEVSSITQDELIASRDGKITVENNEGVLDDLEVNDIISEENITEVEVMSVSEKILERIADANPAQYGIVIDDVKIKALDLPDENKAAVYNRMITERNNIAAAYKAQGQSEAQKIRNTTDKEVSVTVSKANADAAQLEAEGEAEYMKILSEAYNDEGKAEYYSFVRSLDAAKESLGHGNTTLFLDADSPLAKVFEGEGKEPSEKNKDKEQEQE